MEDNNLASGNSRLFAAAAAIADKLEGFSNREVTEILRIVGAQKNLRVTNMLAVQPAQLSQVSSRKNSGKEKGPRRLPKASWKTRPEWVEFEQVHRALVTRIKNASDKEKPELLSQLRASEIRARELKSALRAGNGQ